MHSPGITNLVFLGGSCNPTTWRSEVAIPFLRKVQVNYYNPQVAQWTPELIEEENRAKTNAGVLLFVIDNLTRSVSALIELAELAAGNRILVCVLKQFIQPEARIGGQIISAREYHDLRHAQTVVKRLMERRGVPVFADLPEALAYTADLIKTQRSTDELIRRYATAYRSGLLKAPMKLVRLREIFRSLDVGNNGEIRMYDVQYAYRLITGRSIDEHTIRTVIFYQLRCSDNYVISENNHDLRLNFEQFCCLLAIYEHQQQADCCTNASSNTTTVPAMRSNGKLRPLQWIFDWFSGVHSRIDENHHHHHDHHHNSPASISAKDDALSIGTRSRTPISRLDSVQSVYCNQNVRNSMNDLHQPNSYPSLVIGGTILHQQQSNKTDALNMRHLYPFQAECRDVYLGGTGLPSRWREEIAIPILRKQHVTFYYQYDDAQDDNISAFEASAILNSRILLFVITGDQRSLSSMIMAAHFITKGYNVILCVQHIEDGAVICNEMISQDARKDYNRGRDYLIDLSKRRHVPLFKDIVSSVLHINEKIKEMNRRL